MIAVTLYLMANHGKTTVSFAIATTP